jgi:hypothetical protein
MFLKARLIFVLRARVYPSGAHYTCLKILSGTNTLAYFGQASVTKKKRFL